MDIQQSITSSYLTQSNGQGGGMHEVCDTHKQKCLDTNQDVSLVPLLIGSTPIGAGLLSPDFYLICIENL